MVNKYESFIRDEFEWIYEDTDGSQYLLDIFDGEIDEDEFYEHFDEFMDKATKKYCNDEYYVQIMHENMHDTIIDILKEYLNERK